MVFFDIFWLVCHTISNISLIQRIISNMFSRYLEHSGTAHKKNQRRPLKNFYLKNEILSEYSNCILRLTVSKFQLFSLLLTYNLNGVSRGHVFFTKVKTRLDRISLYFQKVCKVRNYLPEAGQKLKMAFFRTSSVCKIFWEEMLIYYRMRNLISN